MEWTDDAVFVTKAAGDVAFITSTGAVFRLDRRTWEHLKEPMDIQVIIRVP